MAMVCRVCTHDALEAIDQALVSGAAVNALASRYGLSEAAVRRHKGNHLSSALVAAQDAAEASQADSLLAQLRGLLARADD
jgi:transposase-like protein